MTLTNWLRAKPWRWNMRTIYRAHRDAPAHGRLRSLWLTLTFPHVHDDDA